MVFKDIENPVKGGADQAQPFAFGAVQTNTDRLQLGSGNENFVFSPLSILTALNILRLGSQGKSKTQLDKLQGINRLPNLQGSVNAVFHVGPTCPEFLARAKSLFDSHVDTLQSVQQVNDWAKAATNGEIGDLVSSINGASILICNAIFLKFEWAEPFNPGQTTEGPFKGSPRPVMYMRHTQPVECYIKESFGHLSMFGLPFKNGSSLVFNLDLHSDPDFDLKPIRAAVSIPKFKIESTFDLVDPLSKLGLECLFLPSDDFVPILQGDGYVSEIVHKAVIDVDETGATAAAATAILMVRSMYLQDIRTIKIDRPFRYYIWDPQLKRVTFEGVFTGKIV